MGILWVYGHSQSHLLFLSRCVFSVLSLTRNPHPGCSLCTNRIILDHHGTEYARIIIVVPIYDEIKNNHRRVTSSTDPSAGGALLGATEVSTRRPCVAARGVQSR